MKLLDWLLLSTSTMSSAEVAVKKKVVGLEFLHESAIMSTLWKRGLKPISHVQILLGEFTQECLPPFTISYEVNDGIMSNDVLIWIYSKSVWNIPKTSIKCESSIWNHVQLSNHTTPITRKSTERSCSQLNRGSMEPSINLRRTVGELEMTNRKMNTSNLAWHVCIYNCIDIVDM